MARTQAEIRDSICKKLNDAQHALAQASNELTSFDVDTAFVSLAKVNCDNLATMASNLENRVRYLAK